MNWVILLVEQNTEYQFQHFFKKYIVCVILLAIMLDEGFCLENKYEREFKGINCVYTLSSIWRDCKGQRYNNNQTPVHFYNEFCFPMTE